MLKYFVILLLLLTNGSFAQSSLIEQFVLEKGIVFSKSMNTSDKSIFGGLSQDFQHILILQLKSGNVNMTNELDLGQGNGTFRPSNFPMTKYIEYSMFYIGELSDTKKRESIKLLVNNYQKQNKTKAPFVTMRNYDFILVDANLNKVFVIDYNGTVLNESKIQLPTKLRTEEMKIESVNEGIVIHLNEAEKQHSFELDPLSGSIIEISASSSNLR
jgi:hypothetical protein